MGEGALGWGGGGGAIGTFGGPSGGANWTDNLTPEIGIGYVLDYPLFTIVCETVKPSSHCPERQMH